MKPSKKAATKKSPGASRSQRRKKVLGVTMKKSDTQLDDDKMF